MIRLLLLSLAIALAVPARGDEAHPAGPVLLVARADLPDPNFAESVVLVTRRGPAGALGVIINRPTTIPLARVFPDEGKLGGREDRLYFGGPVSRMQMVFVFRADSRPDEAVEVLEGVYLSTDGDLLRKRLGAGGTGEGLRVFAGHAGWAPGQLEAEIERGDWRLMRPEAGAIFSRKPEGLWPELDRRASLTTVLDARP